VFCGHPHRQRPGSDENIAPVADTGDEMTTKRDSKSKRDQRKPKSPKLNKETVKDLDVDKKGEDVKGGGRTLSMDCSL
jgi:hypothetical protein